MLVQNSECTILIFKTFALVSSRAWKSAVVCAFIVSDYLLCGDTCRIEDLGETSSKGVPVLRSPILHSYLLCGSSLDFAELE